LRESGEFYSTASDMALYFPLLELSCGRNYKIEGFHYLYNVNTGLNDYLHRDRQIELDHQIRRKKPYDCHPQFTP
jgi:hypothetical protein